MGATDDQLDFPAHLRLGQAGLGDAGHGPSPNDNLAPLFDMIVAHVPEPKAVAQKDGPFQILSVLIENEPVSWAAC